MFPFQDDKYMQWDTTAWWLLQNKIWTGDNIKVTIISITFTCVTNNKILKTGSYRTILYIPWWHHITANREEAELWTLTFSWQSFFPEETVNTDPNNIWSYDKDTNMHESYFGSLQMLFNVSFESGSVWGFCLPLCFPYHCQTVLLLGKYVIILSR